MPSRSFFYKGKQFPICARCTGELIGFVFGAVLYIPLRFPVWWAFLMLIPLIADGLIQQFTAYESKNYKRLITGLLFGYGIMNLFLRSTVWVFQLGYGMV